MDKKNASKGKAEQKNTNLINPSKMEKTDNEIIAEFMGFTKSKSSLGNTWEHPDMMGVYGGVGQKFKYDTSWDWLMPVVEKIFETAPTDVKEINNEGLDIFELGLTSKIDDVYLSVVEFIKWYNTKPKQNGN